MEIRKVSELLIQDRDNNLLAVLDPQECYNCVKDQTINGNNVLELTIDITHFASQYLKKNNRIMYYDNLKAKWHEYVMSGIEQQGYKITVNAESSLYDTLSNWIDFIDITGNTVVTGLQKIFNTCSPKSNWNAGTSDITGNYQMQRTRYTLKEVIFAWANKVSGELEERIEIVNDAPTRYVDIKQSIGSDKGKVLYDDRDLTDINIEVPVDTIYTMAYGYGKSETAEGSEESKPVTFKDVVWTVAGGDPVDKPAGQEWVALPDEYKQKYGYYDTNGVLQHRAIGYEESGVEVPSELLQRTYDFLLQNVKDQTIYKLTAADYRALNLNPIEISLGDVIGARIAKLGDIYISSKVLRYKEDLKNPDNNDFELENNAKNISSDIINNERQLADLKDRIDRIGDIVFTQNILDKWNQEINAESGYLLVGSPLDGLAVYNAPTIAASTKAVQLKGGSIRIANTKTSGQFDWDTVMTGDGIIADALYTGILAGNMFDLDLDSGIVKMGKRNASGVIDAPTLQLNADGSITMKIGGADLNTTITNINNTVGDLNTSVEDVVQEVAGIQVGATNLLKNTDYRKNINGTVARGRYTATLDTVNKYNGNNTLKVVTTVPGAMGTDDFYTVGYVPTMKDENLLLSFYVKGSVAGQGEVWAQNGTPQTPRVIFNVTTAWTKVEIDFGKITNSVTVVTILLMTFNKAGTFYVNSLMMEYGTKFTDWTPAPGDIANGLTVVESDVVTAQNNIVSLQTGLNGIQADVGQITTKLTTLKSAGSNLAKNTALVEDDSNWQKQVSSWSRFDTSFGSRPYTSPAGTDKHWFVSRNDATWGAVINTMFPAKEGQEYISSCWYFYNNSTDTGAMYLAVFFLDSAGNRLPNGGNKLIKLPNTQAETWLRGSYKIVPPAGTKYMQLYFDAFGPIHGYMSAGYIGEGNIDNGWSPNANDINTEIVTTKTDLAQLHIETDNITQRVTKVEQQEIGVANVLKDSGTPIATDDYLIKEYSVYGLKPNTTYTIVLNGFTSVETKKIGVWFNGDIAPAGYFPVTTTAKTMVLKVTTPATLTQQHISFYNYPSSVAGTGTINWVAAYEGDVKPPLTWTAAPQELAKISFVEQKTTAEALTTTISSGLAGSSQIKTAKYIMDVNGFTIFNAALTMYQGATTSTKKILYFDNAEQQFNFVGALETLSQSEETKSRITGGTIKLYTEGETNLVGSLFAAKARPAGQPQAIALGHDGGDELVIGKMVSQGAGKYSVIGQMSIDDSNIKTHTQLYLQASGNTLRQNGGQISLDGISCYGIQRMYGTLSGSTRFMDFFGNFTVFEGTKNRAVKTKSYGYQSYAAYETPKPYFGDIGSATIDETGSIFIDIDPIFLESMVQTKEYHVFVSTYNGKIIKIERYDFYFVVHGDPGTSFSWEIKAIQIDYNERYSFTRQPNATKEEPDVDYIDEADQYLGRDTARKIESTESLYLENYNGGLLK